jgi:hypothetical protein
MFIIPVNSGVFSPWFAHIVVKKLFHYLASLLFSQKNWSNYSYIKTDHILQKYRYATFKLTRNFFYNFLTKCIFFINPKTLLSVLSINSIFTIIQPIQVGSLLHLANFMINQLPLILGYLAIDQSIAYACDALKEKYFLVQRELCRHSVLASQFNYEGSANVATSYKYSCYANIHVKVEIVIARRKYNIVIHIHV